MIFDTTLFVHFVIGGDIRGDFAATICGKPTNRCHGPPAVYFIFATKNLKIVILIYMFLKGSSEI